MPATENANRVGEFSLTDIVSTTNREVTAVMRDGGRRTVYASGRVELDQ